MSEKFPVRVFISKWAIGGGIKAANARHHSDSYYRLEGLDGLYVMDRDIHEDAEDAVKAANAMVAKRRKQLEKSLAGLKDFTLDDVKASSNV